MVKTYTLVDRHIVENHKTVEKGNFNTSDRGHLKNPKPHRFQFLPTPSYVSSLSITLRVFSLQFKKTALYSY